MTTQERRSSGLLLLALLVASAVTAVVALVVLSRRAPAPEVAASAEHAPVAVMGNLDRPIQSEAGVFLTRAAQLAIAPDSARRRDAHQRTLRMSRALRAYPGAPPRIPHGFTDDEFRTGFCKTCHERGGYAPRFGAYVPITPHPDMGACLQCHVGNDALTSVALPTLDPNSRCRQCHLPGGGRVREQASNFQAVAWLELVPKVAGRGPAAIPHNLQFRGNCLACHSGPAAVTEIRITHPDRVNCRQCHIPVDPDADVYVRPSSELAPQSGDAP
jgi:cytochrome c-type protein NapB